MAAGYDDRHAIELDRGFHDEAVEVDLAFHQAAVLVGRIAERDVDGPARLLGLGDVVTDACRRVETDADLADVVGISGRLDDLPQRLGPGTALERHGSPVTDRDRERL